MHLVHVQPGCNIAIHLTFFLDYSKQCACKYTHIWCKCKCCSGRTCWNRFFFFFHHCYTGMEPSYEVLKFLTHLVVFGNKNLSLNCMHFFDNHSEVSTLRYGPVPTKAFPSKKKRLIQGHIYRLTIVPE